MKKIFFLLVLANVFLSCRKAQISETKTIGASTPWADSSLKHPRHFVFEALLEKYVKKGLPGISLLVNDQDGTWVGAKGKADLETGIDFVPGTVSKAASVTKLFMGVLMFRLMEDSSATHIGYQALTLPISHWLPNRIIRKLPNGSNVRLGQLMNHESGIPDLIEDDDFYLAVLNNPVKKWKQEELLEFVYDEKPLFSPGDTAIYSNTNTILLSMIIEYATGRKHADLLREKILTPLALTNTFYQPHDKLPGTTAQGYFDLYNNNTIVNVSNLVTGSGNGYGGIYSNVFDLYTFINAVLVKKTFLTAKSLAVMQTFGKTDGNNRYGYGIMRKYIERGINAGIGHPGRDVGYTCNLFYFPAKNITHVFFINYGTDGDSRLREKFYEFQEELLDVTLN